MSEVSARSRLGSDFFAAETAVLARGLIGTLLVHELGEQRLVGRIVETEAYLSEGDPASHSAAGKTARNASMFGSPGDIYVYLSYGLHHCLNVVTAREGVGEAVLIRALEPIEGLEEMGARRAVDSPRALCSGPGKLVQALGISREQDGGSFLAGSLYLESEAGAHFKVNAGPRIGISKATELELRFTLAGSPFLSR